MVIARALGLTFWQEFWFEYAVGFLFGWLIFQLKSMTMMTDRLGRALLMAFRAEFFSMLTVMGGMGAVMTYVTPAVVGAQPKATTYAFWGFGMLGLLAGYVFTFPMNWLMVKLGWKHGMGAPLPDRQVRARSTRALVASAMGVLGALALALPAWLTEVREAKRVPDSSPGSVETPAAGLAESLEVARSALREGARSTATHALDAAFRTAQVLAAASPGDLAQTVLDGVKSARRELQSGRPASAEDDLDRVQALVSSAGSFRVSGRRAKTGYEGVPVIDERGDIVGDVVATRGNRVEIATGGARDLWGFLDVGHPEVTSVPVENVLFGPRRALGKAYVMVW
jgi:hypothetical protein